MHEPCGRITFPFPIPWGSTAQETAPVQPRAGEDEIISFLSLYDTSIKMPYLTHSAKPSIFTSSNFIPFALLKGCIHSELFHYSFLIYPLRQQLLSSCLKITTLSSTFLVPFNHKLLPPPILNLPFTVYGQIY